MKAKFSIGDYVRAKQDASDPDFGVFPIKGWVGRISSIDGSCKGKATCGVKWGKSDLETLTLDFRKKCKKQGVEIKLLFLSQDELEPAQANETIDIDNRFDRYGDDGELIQTVLKGVRNKSESVLQKTWKLYLKEHLKLPFQARVTGSPDECQIRQGDELKIHGFSIIDDGYGLIMKVKKGIKAYDYPLGDVEAMETDSVNYNLVRAYAVWFANR